MDNTARAEALRSGAAKLNLEVSDATCAQLVTFGEELLRWNLKVNLTALTGWEEVIEKHFLDSLAVLPELEGSTSLLDLGAGAGFPGIPLSLARPQLKTVLVDSVAKKVGFMKHAIASLGLAGRVRAVHQRATGSPEQDKLPRVEAVIARALVDLEGWLPLAVPYALPGGKVVAMVARAPARESLEGLAARHGLEFVSTRGYALPTSNDPRAVLLFQRR